jgi:hypothetical protein
VIALGPPGARFGDYFDSIESAGRIDNPYAMPNETGILVYVLRRPKEPIATLWPKLKHYE